MPKALKKQIVIFNTCTKYLYIINAYRAGREMLFYHLLIYELIQFFNGFTKQVARKWFKFHWKLSAILYMSRSLWQKSIISYQVSCAEINLFQRFFGESPYFALHFSFRSRKNLFVFVWAPGFLLICFIRILFPICGGRWVPSWYDGDVVGILIIIRTW